MTRRFLAFLEKIIVVSLVSSFALPLALGAWLGFPHPQTPLMDRLRNATLAGVQLGPEPALFNYEEIRSGRFQTAYAEYYNTNFPARELLIRLTDQVYLQAFRASPAGIQIGPHRSLIETAYLQEYYLQRDRNDALHPLVTDLRRLQDACDTIGTPLLVLITPSKASIYPENSPKGWRARYQPGPRFYDHFAALLQEKGVHFVDGHRITAEMKAAPGGPVVFPLGSAHWSDPPALATANAVLGFLAARGLNVAPIKEYDTATAYRTIGSEADLANLLNLAVPMRVAAPIALVSPGRDEGTDRPDIVMVGGSFLDKIVLAMQAACLFSEIHDYSYYRLAERVFSDDGRVEVEGGAPPRNLANAIFGADAIVLECNEQRLTEPNHLTAFLHDALAALPPGGHKPPFHYEGRIAHRWDTTLSFKTPLPAGTALPPMNGFTPPGDIGVYTVGPVAALRLGPLPPPLEDLVLEVTAGSPMTSPAVPEQRVEVFANGHAVGGMAWDGVTLPVRQELFIPKECLSIGGDLTLEFRVAHPLSLQELGRGGDGREMGVCVSSLRVYTARTVTPGGIGPDGSVSAQPLYHWGKEASLREGKHREGVPALRGFTAPISTGAYTQGRFASLRFAVTPPRGAVELTADTVCAVLGRGQSQLTAQVYVNGQRAGEWTWSENSPSQRKLRIAPGVITGGEAWVELRFERVISLLEMGGSDSRKLGVCFGAFQLSEVDK